MIAFRRSKVIVGLFMLLALAVTAGLCACGGHAGCRRG